MLSFKMAKMNGHKAWPSRQAPQVPGAGEHRLVCNRCYKVMVDCEPYSPRGEFFHNANARSRATCPNAGKTFYLMDVNGVRLPENPVQTSFFERKRDRRRHRRVMKAVRT